MFCWIGGSPDCLRINDEKVGAIATEHLIQIGCQRIAHIRGTDVSTTRGRVAGYTKTLTSHHIPLKGDYIVGVPRLDRSATAGGYASAAKLIALNPRPDGMFCCNDPIAIGAMRAILDAGLSIPDDIAVIGAGNLQFDDTLQVPLSSIDQRSEILGQRAAQLAIRLVNARVQLRPKAILLEPSLVIRKSTEKSLRLLIESREQTSSELPSPSLR